MNSSISKNLWSPVSTQSVAILINGSITKNGWWLDSTHSVGILMNSSISKNLWSPDSTQSVAILINANKPASQVLFSAQTTFHVSFFHFTYKSFSAFDIQFDILMPFEWYDYPSCSKHDYANVHSLP